MPVAYSIDSARGLIRTTCSGPVTLKEVVEHFRTLRQDPLFIGKLDVLLNVSDANLLPETSNLDRVVAELRAFRGESAFRACAIVASSDPMFGMEIAEGLISFIVKRCLERRRVDLQTIGRDISRLEKIEPPFPRISYDDAAKNLQEGHAKGALESKFEWGGDLGSPDETYLSAQFDKPVMVHRYPAKVKAFYMEPDPQRPELALCVDVLAPEGYGEIIGGSQRMASHELLLQRIHEHGLPEEAFKWYLDLRKFGSVPHGGFGMGIERVVAWICGLEHVRETIPFPRMLYRLYP